MMMATAAAATAPNNKPMSDRFMGAQKEIWHLEQEIVASLVQVDPDPPMDTSAIGDNPLFHLVRDDHRDIFSFSSKPELYGGVDVSFPSEQQEGVDIANQEAVAVYVVVDRRTMEVLYRDHEYFVLTIPYMPTYLAFREIAPLEVLVHRQIQQRPELTPQAILVDGNGILHPRHAGIACFLGTRTDIPTIGVGKSLLYYEGGWSRETMNTTVDNFVKELHYAIEQNPQTLAPQLSRYRGLILKKTSGVDPTTCSSDVPMAPPVASLPKDNEEENQDRDRKKLLQDLAPFCNGIAIPLKGGEDARFPLLGCALVGHGGQIAATSKSAPVAGTSKPIFVSVGHKISPQKAVQITASLSLARVPEPVRQADLYGRELMRKRISS